MIESQHPRTSLAPKPCKLLLTEQIAERHAAFQLATRVRSDGSGAPQYPQLTFKYIIACNPNCVHDVQLTPRREPS
jgi:hypothetical protein